METADTTETTRTFWWNMFETYKPINAGWFRELAFSVIWYAMELAMIITLGLGLYQAYKFIRMAIQ